MHHVNKIELAVPAKAKGIEFNLRKFDKSLRSRSAAAGSIGRPPVPGGLLFSDPPREHSSRKEQRAKNRRHFTANPRRKFTSHLYDDARIRWCGMLSLSMESMLDLVPRITVFSVDTIAPPRCNRRFPENSPRNRGPPVHCLRTAL